jgi:hypothetical protein
MFIPYGIYGIGSKRNVNEDLRSAKIISPTIPI